MAVRYATGFETGPTRPNIDLAGDASISPRNKISGKYSLRCELYKGGTAYGIIDLSSAGGTVNAFPSGNSDSYSVRFNYKVREMPRFTVRRIWEAVQATGSTHLIILRQKATGLLEIIGVSGGQDTGTTVLLPGQKYQINIVFTRSTDTVQVYIDGKLEFNFAGAPYDFGTANADFFIFGERNAGTADGEDSPSCFIYDDIVIRDDTTYINPGENRLGILNAAGTYTTWTNALANVDDIDPDDGTGTEIIGAANNDMESYTIVDPTGALAINAVMIRSVMIKSGASASTCQVLSRVAGADELSETITLGQTAYANGSVQTFAPPTQPTQAQLAAWEIGLKAIDSTADPKSSQIVAEIDCAYTDPKTMSNVRHLKQGYQ